MDRGWSMKNLHRLIVTSATYRQSSVASPELRERDPYNRLLARGPRLRIDAESVRDVALAASGLLNEKLGGPSVHPPLPEFLFLAARELRPEELADRVRGRSSTAARCISSASARSRIRCCRHSTRPNGDFACVRRSRSDTPLQALMTLNEPVFLECAGRLALRTVTDGGSDDDERLAFTFRRCLARRQLPSESATLKQLLSKERRSISLQAARSRGTSPPPIRAHPPKLPDGTKPSDLAAWTVVSRVLLNLDETITKE